MRGFTLVELLMVIVIIGILAAVVGPRFFDRQVFDDRLFFEEGLAAVRYGQKLAVASGCRINVRVDANGYLLTYAQNCGDQDEDPKAGGSIELPSGPPVSRQPVTVTPELNVTFNSLGCVSIINTCPSSAVIISTVIGGFTIRVHAATGFIETTP